MKQRHERHTLKNIFHINAPKFLPKYIHKYFLIDRPRGNFHARFLSFPAISALLLSAFCFLLSAFCFRTIFEERIIILDITDASANLLLAFTTYAIGTASPGPSNFAVMAPAMNVGRKHAAILALGVVTGSGIWGLLAAFGLAAAISTYSIALIFMKVVGGLNLLWLASELPRSASSSTNSRKATCNGILENYFMFQDTHLLAYLCNKVNWYFLFWLTFRPPVYLSISDKMTI